MDNFKYQLKILTNEKAMIFWAFVFPLILATFFNLAFSNLNNIEFEPVKVAIVEDVENVGFRTYISEISKKNKNQLVSVKYAPYDKANQLLADGEVSGYFVVRENVELVVNENGYDQTILKAILDKYFQISMLIENVSKNQDSTNIEEIMANIDLSKNNFVEVKGKNLSATVIPFYSLIAMTCLYGCFWGLKAVTINEANLSYQGARLNVSPNSKLKSLLTGLFASFIVHYLCMLTLFSYMMFVLKIDFGNQISSYLLLMALGTFVGIMLGNLVGNIFKVGENTKVGILLTITMVSTFLSGMMVTDVKYAIEQNLPIVALINPASLITDGLYSLYFSNVDRFNTNMLSLFVLSLVMMSFSFIMMRRKQYDSI